MMKTWLTCKRKFHINYIDGIRSEQTQSLALGTASHEALEEANKYLQPKPHQLNPMEIEFYIQKFRECLAKQHIDNQEAFEVGEEAVRGELSICGEEKILGIEEEFDIVTPEGVRIYGFIDKLVEDDEHPSTIRIIDYKTSVMPMSFEEARLDEQLAMYDLAMSIKYPQYENRIVELRYLRSGERIRVYKTAIEQQNFRRRILAVDKAIRAYVEEATTPPKGETNQFCAWCSYKEGCPVYVQHMNTLLPECPNVEVLDDKSFLDMWTKVMAIQSAADSWKESLKLWALQRLEAFPDNPIDNGEKQIYTLSQVRREYNAATVGKLIGLKDLLGGTTGESLVKINNKALENFLKKKRDAKLQAKIEEAVTVKFNSPQIRLKKS